MPLALPPRISPTLFYFGNVADVSLTRYHEYDHRKTIEEALNAGKNVIVDRYSYSGVAFSSSKGLDIDWCYAPEKGLLAPDVVIYLDLSIEESQKRGEFGNERYEKVELQTKVRSSFHKMKTESWKVIDANRAPDEIFDDIKAVALSTIETSATAPFTHL